MGIQSQRGSSLIEVMVALFVLAIGLLGMLAMQSKSMQYNQSAYAFSQAVYLVSDMAERIRANPGQAAAYAGGDLTRAPSGSDPSPSATSTCRAGLCTPAELVAEDQDIWAQNVARYLPDGQAFIEEVTAGGYDFVQVRVSFVDDKYDEGDDDDDDPKRLDYSMLVEI